MSNHKAQQAFDKGVTGTSNILNYIGTGMLLVLMLMGAFDVIGRYLFNKPITGTLEIGEAFLPSMVFLSWAYTQVLKQQVSVDIVIARFRPRARAITDFVTNFIVLLLFGLMTWQGALVTRAYWERGRLISPVIEWPLAIFQGLIPICAAVTCLVLIAQMIQLLPKMKKE